MRKIIITCISTLLVSGLIFARRSVHRPRDPFMPKITTQWVKDKQSQPYSISSTCLELWPLERTKYFHDKYRKKYAMPNTITYRYEPQKTAFKEKIINRANKLVEELLSQKRKPHEKEFKDFKVLKDRDFNFKENSGLIVLESKKHPFVIKLYMENPKSFTKPFTKGIEPCFFFAMGGGINRYLMGITRIPNLHAINDIVAADPYWSKRITTPRKWLLIPDNTQWFTITTENMGADLLPKVYTLPSVYMIICDKINGEREFSIGNADDRHTAMHLAQFIGNRIDPHICNFIYEKDTGKIAFIDTEHFASQVGLREPLYFNHYSSWYTRLGNKCFYDSFLKTKRDRKDIQRAPLPDILHLEPKQPQAARAA